MFDVKKLFNQYLDGQAETVAGGSSKAGGFGGLAGGALAGGLVGLLAGTKTGRKIGKNALTYGGTAVLGGLAYKAWRDWQSGKPASTPPRLVPRRPQRSTLRHSWPRIRRDPLRRVIWPCSRHG